MAFSKDEAWGIIGQLEGLRDNVKRGQNALRAIIEGRFGMSGEPGILDINAMRVALSDAENINDRLGAEIQDPDGAFGS